MRTYVYFEFSVNALFFRVRFIFLFFDVGSLRVAVRFRPVPTLSFDVGDGADGATINGREVW